MRVIAGIYKGRELSTIKGDATRPTTSFNRELIFSTLYDVEDLSVLDLYAGSGALAFEALSRGANDACLVDMSDKALTVILQNANRLNCKDKIIVQKMKVELFLKKTERQFDLILADPPFNKNCVNAILELIFERNVIAEDGMLVLEHSCNELIDQKFMPYIEKQKVNGNITISFFSKSNNT
ncbi:MAG TPA: 16S rRNA (guanine(966)-N(2))-methyltransferase RsmD [Candidatus Cloacimonadota bacterium]|nr:16S rRNA (guanine(966)-N(2))-methyltransferase RsmD [Candidatus Cloacimonadota bacterium]